MLLYHKSFLNNFFFLLIFIYYFKSWIWRAEVDPAKGPLDTRPVLSIYEWDETMRVTKNEVNYKLENTTVSPHDFSITKNYYVFIENRVQGDTLPYLLGTKCPAQCVDIVPNEPMIINLVPRNNVYDKKSISYTSALDPGFTIHSVCAFENLTKNASQSSQSSSPFSSSSNCIDKDSGTIELITTGWKTETVASGSVKGGLLGSWEGKAPLFDNIPVTLLYHTILDLETLQLISHSPVIGMENTIVEHPHINPLFEASVVRYLFMSVGSVKGKSSPPLGYLKLNIKTGEKSVWYAPEHTYCEELIVVPKYQAKVIDKNIIHEEEDDVWLIGCLFDAVEERSYFAIFDGKKLTTGPIARLWLSHHLPHSLHGSFVSKIFDHDLI